MLRSIRVLGKKHKIERNVKIKDAWGEFDPNKNLIRLSKLPTFLRQEVLLHEVMHAIEGQFGFDMDHDHLTLMARGLVMVMRENPELAAELFGDE